QALKKAEEARKEAQRKLDQRQAETLRAQLEKVRLDQTEQVNKPTTAIEKSRKPDGSLTRENAVVLNQLPGKEGDLSKRMAELRLLKAMQLAVNKNTKAADALPKAQQDKPGLVALGNRQGKLRTLLDNLLKKATQGKEGLNPEPDPKDKLPEEAGKETIETKE